MTKFYLEVSFPDEGAGPEARWNRINRAYRTREAAQAKAIQIEIHNGKAGSECLTRVVEVTK